MRWLPRLTTYAQSVSEELLLRLGREVRRRRLALGLTRVQLAERSGVHRNYLASVERGDRNISVGNLFRIAKALETTLPELLLPVTSDVVRPIEPQ